MKKLILDPDEKRLLESYERGEWKPSKHRSAEVAKLQQYARNTLQKNKRINIRLSERDLLGIQTKAVEEGLPYQTLISSVLHKYLRGTLTEKKRA
ncbi:MAG: antitoxin [Phycisphaerae bacterium]|nr:antitoxin [Phycisphaerae bacterium]